MAMEIEFDAQLLGPYYDQHSVELWTFKTEEHKILIKTTSRTDDVELVVNSERKTLTQEEVEREFFKVTGIHLETLQLDFLLNSYLDFKF